MQQSFSPSDTNLALEGTPVFFSLFDFKKEEVCLRRMSASAAREDGLAQRQGRSHQPETDKIKHADR
jgi:hypothetical protein